MKLSIIIPVYNAENYLDRCIESILAQRYTDYELILVDDGSSDRSGERCDYYARNYPNIKAIHIENSGVSVARNKGIKIAAGEYLTFVDSDDWIESQMYQDMMDIADEYNCDVVMCDCVKDFTNHSELYTHEIRAGYYDYEQLKAEYYPHLLMMENIEYPATISNFLCVFRRSILRSTMQLNEGRETQHDENCLHYVEGVRFSEDLLFGAQMMLNAKSFYYLKNKAYYHYCINPSSASHTFKIDKWTDYMKLLDEANKSILPIQEYNFQPQIDKMLLFFLYNAIGDIRVVNELTLKRKREVLKSILSNEDVREMFKRISVHRLPISWRLKLYTYTYKFYQFFFPLIVVM